MSVLLGRGDGGFDVQVTYPTGRDPQAVAVGDLNGDGKADLAVANYVDSDVSVLLGHGTAPSPPSSPTLSGRSPPPW